MFTTFNLEKGCLEMTGEWFQKCLIQREMEMQIALYPGPSPVDLEPPPPSFLYKKKQPPVQFLLRALICVNVVTALSTRIVSQTTLFWLYKAKIVIAAP